MCDVTTLRRNLKKLNPTHTVKANVFGDLSIYNRKGQMQGYVCMKTGALHLDSDIRGKSNTVKLWLLLVLIIILVGLNGCSYVRYSGEKSSLVGIEIGTKTALEGLTHHRDSENFDLTIESMSIDSAAGVEAIVAGTIKGMKK